MITRTGTLLATALVVITLTACEAVVVAPQAETETPIVVSIDEVEAAFEDFSSMGGTFAAQGTIIALENQGQDMVGTLTVPTGADAPYPAVLLLHGFTSPRDELPIVGTEEAMFSRTARILAENGIASLRIDFRGSGESDGLWEDTTFSGQTSDAVAALDYLSSHEDIEPNRIGVIGLSQGGLIASELAATENRIQSVVLWSPVTNPVDTFELLLGEENVQAGLVNEAMDIVLPWGAEIVLNQPFFEELYSTDPVASISKVSAPLMVVVGVRDDIVAPQPQYGQIFLNYHDGSEMLISVDGDHGFDVLSGNGPGVFDEVIIWSLAWLTESL